MKPWFFLALVLLVADGLSGQSAAPNPNVLFVFDASGSMWQKVDGAYKISVAKSVMQELIAQLPAGSRAGLVAYGHRQKSDCADIETLVPPGPLQVMEFTARLSAIDPKGMTPIARSLQHAIGLAEKEPTAMSCVLISDGLETCDGNACEIVRQARARGVRITLHVVGFALSEKDHSTLECIAQAGGGQYWPAANAGELADALKKAVAPTPAGSAWLSVRATQAGQPLDVMVKVFKKGERRETALGRTYTGPETNPRVFALDPATYEIQATAIGLDGKPVQTLRDLTVKAGDTTLQTVDFAQGQLTVAVRRNGQLSDATVSIFEAGTRQSVTTGRSYRDAQHNPMHLKLLPGSYDVEIKSVEIEGEALVVMKDQRVRAGETLDLAQDFSSGTLRVGARKGAELVDATLVISDKKTGRQIAAGRSYTQASSNPKAFVLVPGAYRVEITPAKQKDLPKKTFEVELKAGETLEKIAEW